MSKHQDYFRKMAELCREYKITVGDGSAAALLEFFSRVQLVKEPASRVDHADASALAAYLHQAVDMLVAGEVFDLDKTLLGQSTLDPNDPVVRRTARKILKNDARLEYAKPAQAHFVRRLNGNGRNGNSKRPV